jgi:hypothetical protein
MTPKVTPFMSAIAALVCPLLCANLNAAALIDESFSYPDGPVVGAPGSAWTTHSGTAGQAAIQTGELRLSQANSEDINLLLPEGPFPANANLALYARLQVSFTTLPGAAGAYFAHFKGGTATAFRGRLFATTAGAAAGGLRLGVASGDSSPSAVLETDLTLETPYTVILRYQLDTGVTTLWVNPAAESDPNASSTDPASPLAIASFAFRQAAGIGAVNVDALRVGTSFADVTGPSTTVLSIVASDPSASEAGENYGQFVVARAGDTSTDLSLNLEITGTAANGADYEEIPTTVVIPSGQPAILINVLPIADSEAEPAETVQIKLLEGTGFVIGPAASAIVAITELDVVQVTVTASGSTASETGPATGQFTVARTGPTTTALEIQLVYSGTASNGVDFDTLSTTVSIPSGFSSTDIIVSPIDDQIPEGDELVTVKVLAGVGYEPIGSAEASITIADDDFVVGLLLEEDFDYPNGALVGVDTSPWVTHSGTTNQVNIVAGEVELSQGDSEDVSAMLFGGPYGSTDGGMLYAGFTLTLQTLPAGAGTYFAHFKGASATAHRGRVFVTSNGATPGAYRVGVSNGSSSVTTEAIIQRDLMPNATYAIMIGYDLASATTRLWLDQANEADPSVAAADSTSAISISAFALRQSFSIEDGMGKLRLDNLLVGRSFDAVRPAGKPVVSMGVVDGTANELGSDHGSLIFSRSGQFTEPLTIKLEFGGVATPGIDYESLPTSVTIPAGESQLALEISPIDDDAAEAEEMITVSVLPDAAYSINPPGTAVVVIGASDETASQPPAMSQPRVGADGSFEFELRGELNRRYEVQVTSDFVRWDRAGLVEQSAPVITVVDPESKGLSMAFYRAILIP